MLNRIATTRPGGLGLNKPFGPIFLGNLILRVSFPSQLALPRSFTDKAGAVPPVRKMGEVEENEVAESVPIGFEAITNLTEQAQWKYLSVFLALSLTSTTRCELM